MTKHEKIAAGSAVVRTPNGNDYGKDLLRQHYAQHDHSHPMTAHRQTPQ